MHYFSLCAPVECLYNGNCSTLLLSCVCQATFKRYQSEHKLKQDSLERSKTDLKKLRRKSQGKHSSKYEIKENEVSPAPCTQYTSDGFPSNGAVAYLTPVDRI